MINKQEKELIIKNAFEFLKRDDLIIVNGVITFPFLKAKSLKEYETYELSYCKDSFFCKTQKIKIRYKSNIYGLSVIYLSDDQNLIKLFDKIYNRIKTKQEQAEKPQDDLQQGKAKQPHRETLEETRKLREEFRQRILDAVSKFLGRDNLYASVKATYPHTPSIDMDSIGNTNPNDIIHLYFDEKRDFLNNKFERKLYLVADYWSETKILWESVWLPMEKFPEAYKMFLDKYEQLDGKNKLSKEKIEKYRKELKMIEATEQETIIKNAIEFLKRENLIADIDEKIISLDFCLNTYCGIYKIKLDDEKDCLLMYKEPRKYPIKISSDNKELYDLFNETYNKLTEHKSFFSKELTKKLNCNCENEPVSSKCAKPRELTCADVVKKAWEKDLNLSNPNSYSDNDEHRDEEMLKACQQGLDLVDEMVEQSNTKQDTDINIPNNGKYRRKSDGKIFFLISQHELKTTMNGITPSKEICEIVVDITKIYVLFSPALEGRYNHDILYVKENELNEEYKMLSED